MRNDNDFTIFLETINRKSPQYISKSYERESSIINSYMKLNHLSGVDTRLALESVYGAFIKDKDTLVKQI